MKVKRVVVVSESAYHEIKRRIANNRTKYASRGAVGVIDDLLFGTFTTNARGNKKVIDKK